MKGTRARRLQRLTLVATLAAAAAGVLAVSAAGGRQADSAVAAHGKPIFS